MKVIGHSYDADYHCQACTHAYIKEQAEKELDEAIQEFLNMGTEFEFVPQDSEGNPIHPIFDTDEWYANDIYEGNASATLNCSDCGAEMDSWHSN